MCSRLRVPSSEYSTGARFGRSSHRSNRRRPLPVGLPTDVGEVFCFVVKVQRDCGIRIVEIIEQYSENQPTF